VSERSKDFLLGMWTAGCLGVLYIGNHTLAVWLGIFVVAFIIVLGVITNDS
jgi:hypothetical protein